MSILDNIRGWFARSPTIPVVNNPQANVPVRRWSNGLGPGAPVTPTIFPTDEAGKIAAAEPKSFQILPNINATLTPRTGYGLMAFSDLKNYAETVPECSLAISIKIAALKNYVPVIKSPDGEVVQKAASTAYRDSKGQLCKTILPYNEFELPSVSWMTTYPDQDMAWSNWIVRAIWNREAYDAYCVAWQFGKHGQIEGMTVLDGSTIFAVIDENARTPRPPTPAYQQILLGFPRGNYTTNDIYYAPSRLRPNAPYGTSFIENSLEAVKFLQSWWEYQRLWYTAGSAPDRDYAAPAGWSVEQIFAYMEALGAHYDGNPSARQQPHTFPNGFSLLADRSGKASGPSGGEGVYQTAKSTVMMAAGIPQSEYGEAPSEGLGGKGYAEAGESLTYRQAYGPVITDILAPFNLALEMNGYSGYTLDLEYPEERNDPEAEEERHTKRWQIGAYRRNEYLDQIGLPRDESPEGNMFYPEIAALGGQGATAQQGASQTIDGGPLIPLDKPIRVTGEFPKPKPPALPSPITVKALGDQGDLLKSSGSARSPDPDDKQKTDTEAELRDVLTRYFDDMARRLEVEVRGEAQELKDKTDVTA